jgi:hypothetical protein
VKSAFAQALGVAEKDVTVDFKNKLASVESDVEVDESKLASALEECGFKLGK